LDGTNVFATEEDTRNEREVAAALSKAWACEIHSWGALAACDWYATRYGRMVGVLELKSKAYPSTKYPGVYLNVRKWLALWIASGLGNTRGIFVVRFTDGIFDSVGNRTGEPLIGGCRRIVKSPNDIEPLIEIMINKLKPLYDQSDTRQTDN
jgi:hypothetical protein